MALGIDTQLVTVTVDAAPLGVPSDAPVEIQCLLELGDYTQTRSTTDIACMTSNDSTTALGAITRDPLNFEMLYNEDDLDGQELLKAAFDNNESVMINIEFNNADTTAGETDAAGTMIDALMGVSVFTFAMPKDGKIGATFALVFQGSATISPMVPGTAP